MAEPYLSGTILEYLEDAAAGRPTPGGGSVSALTGALAMTMGEMALNFTVGKKRYADVEAECRDLLETLSACRRECAALVDRDVAAYAAVSRAYALPRGTDDEKAARAAAIQESLKTAMAPPLATFRALVGAIEAIRRAVDLANPNLVSDVGVSAALARSALLGARLNVEINLASLKDAALVADVTREIEAGAARGVSLTDETFEIVRRRIVGDD